MIVTVTLDPCLEVRYQADRLEIGSVTRVGTVRQRAGGRGLAVARLLATFGHEVVAAGLAGGSAGDAIRADLARAGVPTAFTRIGAESRRVIRLATSADGQVTTIEEPAPYITTEELGRLATDYRRLLDGATAVVLCGALPASLPAETYGSFTSYAAAAAVPVILDAGGSALGYGMARGPAVVIPDLVAGQPEPAWTGQGSLVLVGGGAVRVQTEAGRWCADIRGPLSPGPAGAFRDALVAGFVPGAALGWSWPDMLRHAIALAGSVTDDGGPDLASYEALLPAVRIRAR